jgi:hypothetical protein
MVWTCRRRDAVEYATLAYGDWFNPRRQSVLGMGTPVPFQTAHASQSAQALLVSSQASESPPQLGAVQAQHRGPQHGSSFGMSP